MLNYTDLCTQCNASLKEQFLDRLRDSLTGFVATAPLAEIVQGDRRIQFVAAVRAISGAVHYEIIDNYRIVGSGTHYKWMLDEYEKYVRERL